MTITFSIEQLDQVAQQILEQNPNKVLLFNGEMGAGKTTLIKKLCKHLGVNEPTSSPTFSLVNEYYTTNNQYIYHFDCYRLKSEIEALDMGIDEYLYSGHWCFIEWAEKIATLIPEEHSIITIEILPDGNRTLVLT
ncbi:tRNA (adenosine(37)-N6)-threonylcarbamoyltransferase complex ATPase subunit type 1 TsaE [Flavobacterium sp.]|jgi:tRNA threonylcarbamoyladenosine biosynthesis protein TsaE|uniref:tRNA (adenosine(37)-N6)-threonylcarbamoyltransferase complex ATPase subunit type 1 TsaE n=1 Tax=Flavobacterium sp. TaxID=239 RepID=UPI0022BE9642|nr:tRNA (adenosine(37)-N6)-threonylcarbamoyltransferase complex ATPase subunit type 1 TsaE [Flavobacterium sp.]MCZ8228431.1 tRNA (adenosine(37)-N6)-threonylcarbamoyltransferase complex ATPase subunit type 1 TsaE [Flavobacterium sp.]